MDMVTWVGGRVWAAAYRRPVTAAGLVVAILALLVLPTLAAVIAVAAIVWFGSKAAPWQRERLERIDYQVAWEGSARALGVANREGAAPEVASVAQTPSGREVLLKLRPGITAEDLTLQAADLADAHGAVRCIVKPDKPGWARVLYFDRDPLAVPPGTWPGVHSASVPLTVAVPLGLNEDGEVATVALWQSSVLLGGLPGSGKSAAMQLLVSGAALDPTADLRIIDAKRGAELGMWRSRATAFAANDVEAVQVLNDVLGEIERRYDAMQAAGIRKVSHGDPGFPPVVVVVDELAEVTGTGSKDAKAAGETLRRIVALGRAAGVTVIAATQKPDSTVVPTGLRDLFKYRLGLRCGARGQAETIAAEVAAELCTIPADAPGTGYLLTDAGMYARVRCFYLTDSDLEHLARRLSDDAR